MGDLYIPAGRVGPGESPRLYCRSTSCIGPVLHALNFSTVSASTAIDVVASSLALVRVSVRSNPPAMRSDVSYWSGKAVPGEVLD